MKGNIVKIEILDAGTINASYSTSNLKSTLTNEKHGGMILNILENRKKAILLSALLFLLFVSSVLTRICSSSAAAFADPRFLANLIACTLYSSSYSLFFDIFVSSVFPFFLFYSLVACVSSFIIQDQNLLKIYWTPEVEEKVLKRIKPRNIEEDITFLKDYLS